MSYYFNEENELIFKNKEIFQPFMDPLLFAKNNRKIKGLISPKMVLNLFQVAFLKLLNVYLNESSLSRWEKLFFPFSRSSSRLIREKLGDIYTLSSVASEAGIYFENYKNLSSEALKPSAFGIARIISALYADYENLICNFGSNIVKKYLISNSLFFDKSTYMKKDSQFFKPLVRFSFIADNLISDMDLLILYGSLANFNYVAGFSSVDIMGIIKGDVLHDPERIVSFRKKVFKHLNYLYRIDPFGSSGILFFSALDLRYFPQHFFPLILFNQASSIFEFPNCIKVHERDTSLDRMKMLWDACYFARYRFLTGSMVQNLYDYRDFLRSASMLPALYYQLDGRYFFKKDAVDKFIKDYNYVDLFEKLMQTRAGWIQKNFAQKHKKALTGLVNPFIWPLIYRKMASLKNEDKNNYGWFLKQYFKLTEKVIEDLFKHYASWHRNFLI